MLRQPGIPGRHVAAQTVIKECQRRIPQRLRHATVKGLGDAARDGGLRVAVAPSQTALRTASSKEWLSRKAMMASGTDSWQLSLWR